MAVQVAGRFGQQPTEKAKPQKEPPLLALVATTNLGGSVISTLATKRIARFTKWAVALPCITADATDIALVTEQLKAAGYTMTSAQADEMQEKTDAGVKTGMRTDGWGNFFFLENPDGSVSVGYRGRLGGRWCSRVYSLDDGYGWDAGHRLLVCNLKGALKL